MNSLKRRTIWLDKRGADEENNMLVIRWEKTVALSPAPPSNIQTCSIEVSSPSEDDYGQPAKKRRTFTVDEALVGDIGDAMGAIERAQTRALAPQDSVVQIRYEGSSAFVVMSEIPAKEAKGRYVIGDGAEIRFILGELQRARKAGQGNRINASPEAGLSRSFVPLPLIEWRPN
jgi:hypothetical protein